MIISSKKSFTLIEALAASIIMAIGLFSVISVSNLQTIFLNDNREQTIAALTAQGEIEFLRGQPFDDIVTRSFYEDDAPGLAHLHYNSGFGKGDIVVDSAVFTNDSNIKRVSVIVTWDSVKGKTLQRIMATLVTKNGINKQ
jgi:hypothetical protein